MGSGLDFGRREGTRVHGRCGTRGEHAENAEQGGIGDQMKKDGNVVEKITIPTRQVNYRTQGNTEPPSLNIYTAATNRYTGGVRVRTADICTVLDVNRFELPVRQKCRRCSSGHDGDGGRLHRAASPVEVERAVPRLYYDPNRLKWLPRGSRIVFEAGPDILRSPVHFPVKM